MGETFKGLRGMSKGQLIDEFDRRADHVHLQFPAEMYLAEFARREAAEQTEAIRGMTGIMTWLTVVITVLTVINVAITAWIAFR
jgi:hypothetical protein